MHETPLIARRDTSVLVVVDIQEKLFPLMQDGELLAERVETLIKGADVLGVPVIVTEQYRKGLGPTLPRLLEAGPATVVEKTTFSCFGDDLFGQALRDTERSQVVVCGIETHICVMQTCLDARSRGWDTFVVADAVSSRLPHTGPVGLERMRAAGCVPTTTEGVLFEIMERCDTEAFKKILPLVREGR